MTLMIIINLLTLVTLIFVLLKMAFFCNKLGDIYDLQIKFNDNERAYANECEKQYNDFQKKIAELEKEIEIKDEFVDKIYTRQSQLEKFLRTKLK